MNNTEKYLSPNSKGLELDIPEEMSQNTMEFSDKMLLEIANKISPRRKTRRSIFRRSKIRTSPKRKRRSKKQ